MEQEDTARFERLHDEWERQNRDPDDVFFHARDRREGIKNRSAGLQRALKRQRPSKKKNAKTIRLTTTVRALEVARSAIPEIGCNRAPVQFLGDRAAVVEEPCVVGPDGLPDSAANQDALIHRSPRAFLFCTMHQVDRKFFS